MRNQIESDDAESASGPASRREPADASDVDGTRAALVRPHEVARDEVGRRFGERALAAANRATKESDRHTVDESADEPGRHTRARAQSVAVAVPTPISNSTSNSAVTATAAPTVPANPAAPMLRFLRDIHLWRNTAPVANVVGNPDPSEQTAQGVVTGVDMEGDPLTFAVVRQPRTGSVTVDAASGAFTYTPGVGEAAADSFSVAVNDGLPGGTRVVMVSVNLADVPTARKVDVAVGSTALEIPGGTGGFDVPADWYFPTGDEPPKGIIWLQHGFLADKAFYAAMATTLAEQTNSIVVAPNLTSNFLAPGGYWLNGRPMQQSVADMFTGDRAQLHASAAAAGYTGELPQEFVLVGHSAGGGFAAAVAGYTVDNGAVEHLAGVVMFDGVALNEGLAEAMAKLGTLDDAPQIYQIAAPSQMWNAFDRGTGQLLDARPDQFNGVVLAGGSHVDAMLGGNPLIDLAAQLVTQASPPGNTQAVGTLAVGWINDFYDDTRFGIYGTPGQQLIVDNVTVSVLPAHGELSQFELLARALTSAVMRLLFDGPAVEDPAGVTVAHSDLELADGVIVDADWYFPDRGAEPTGVIYLQHGFFRSNSNVSALAVQLARQTNSVVVAPMLSSNFLGDAYWINGEQTQVAVAELFAGDRSALNASAAAAGYTGGVLPQDFVLVGHSAGGNLVTGAGGLIAGGVGVGSLKGIVLLDAVDRDGNMAAGLSALPASTPVYQIAAAPCICNSFGSGTKALIEDRPGQFVGVRIVGGTHVDAEGASTDLLGSLACGFSQPGNPAAVQAIAAGWIDDMFGGHPHDGVYPAAGESMKVGRATVVGLGDPGVEVVETDHGAGVLISL